MKNKLPDFPKTGGTSVELITGLWNYNVDLHTYIAELTEIVEALQSPSFRDVASPNFCVTGTPGFGSTGYIKTYTPTLKETMGDWKFAPPINTTIKPMPTPTLKETLLRTMLSKSWIDEDDNSLIKLSDVEAIINRLMP